MEQRVLAMTKARVGLYFLVLPLVVAVWPAATEATLPPAPFELRATPSPWQEGRQARIRVDLLKQGSNTIARELFDIYIVRIPGAPSPHAYLYLSPTALWTSEPTAYRRATSFSAVAPLVAEWREPGPPGDLYVLVAFVRASADFLNRRNWVFQPLLTIASVRVPWGNLGRAVVILGALGIVTVAAVVLVALHPQSSRVAQ